MLQISSEQVDQELEYPELIQELKSAFGKPVKIPSRQHYIFPGANGAQKGNFLLMPAWDNGNNLGVKIITIVPDNAEKKIPVIQGSYFLYDAETGVPKALFDAKSLTIKRTAATSALASQYLSRKDSSTMLMIGTGNLASELIRAHASVRPIKKVYVLGRSLDKAERIRNILEKEKFEIAPVLVYKSFIKEVDIVCCATLSSKPLVFGRDLVEGQHLDLVGSYKPTTREADDDAIIRSEVYVDTMEGAPKESGDIFIPLNSGKIKMEDIKGDLFDLCQGRAQGRTSENQITLFKSVGYALEDLVAAKLVYQKLKNAKSV